MFLSVSPPQSLPDLSHIFHPLPTSPLIFLLSLVPPPEPVLGRASYLLKCLERLSEAAATPPEDPTPSSSGNDSGSEGNVTAFALGIVGGAGAGSRGGAGVGAGSSTAPPSLTAELPPPLPSSLCWGAKEPHWSDAIEAAPCSGGNGSGVGGCGASSVDDGASSHAADSPAKDEALHHQRQQNESFGRSQHLPLG